MQTFMETQYQLEKQHRHLNEQHNQTSLSQNIRLIVQQFHRDRSQPKRK